MDHIDQSIFRLEAIKSYTIGSQTPVAPNFNLPKSIILLWFILGSCVATSLLLSVFQIPVIINGKIFSPNVEIYEADVIHKTLNFKIIIPNNSLKYIKKTEVSVRFEQTQVSLECRILSLEASDKTLLDLKEIKMNKSNSNISFIEVSCQKPTLDSKTLHIFENLDTKSVQLELDNAQVYSLFLYDK